MGPCGRCWGRGETCIMEMGDEGMCVGHEKCTQCGGSGIEPPATVLVIDWDAPIPQWALDMDERYRSQYPNEWDI